MNQSFRILFPCLFLGFAPAARADSSTYNAHLTGDEEVPARDTKAQGQITLHVSYDDDGNVASIDYKLIVANIENVTAAHLHLAPAGSNGGVVVGLAGNFAPGGGRTQGVLAEGSIGALSGALAGMSLDALVDAIDAGNIYVNVHTNDGAGASNTGPGDFASGEIRGQVQ